MQPLAVVQAPAVGPVGEQALAAVALAASSVEPEPVCLVKRAFGGSGVEETSIQMKSNNRTRGHITSTFAWETPQIGLNSYLLPFPAPTSHPIGNPDPGKLVHGHRMYIHRG